MVFGLHNIYICMHTASRAVSVQLSSFHGNQQGNISGAVTRANGLNFILSVFIRRPQADSRGATSRPPCREFVNAAPRKSMNYLKRKNTAKPIGCSWKYFSRFTFGRSGCLIFRDESNASVVKPFAVTHCDNVLQHFSWINSDSLPVHTHNDLFRL